MTVINKSKPHVVVSPATTLTASYTAGTVFSIDEHNCIGVQLTYIKGDETSMQIKLEMSTDDGVTYGQEITETGSGSTITCLGAERSFNVTGTYSFLVFYVKGDAVRISTKATGGTPTGTIGVTAIAGRV